MQFILEPYAVLQIHRTKHACQPSPYSVSRRNHSDVSVSWEWKYCQKWCIQWLYEAKPQAHKSLRFIYRTQTKTANTILSWSGSPLGKISFSSNQTLYSEHWVKMTLQKGTWTDDTIQISVLKVWLCLESCCGDGCQIKTWGWKGN